MIWLNRFEGYNNKYVHVIASTSFAAFFMPHIGIVTDQTSSSAGNPLIVHNIGAGPSVDDVLFSYKITGHYRYVPKKYSDLDKRPPSW